jgi:hypothetical protein
VGKKQVYYFKRYDFTNDEGLGAQILGLRLGAQILGSASN